MYIDGSWSAAKSGRTFKVTNPANGEVISEVSDGNGDDAVQAIEAAAVALPMWAAQTAFARSEILYRGWQLMTEASDELARTMTEEQGKPLRAARIEVKYAADFLLWYAEQAKRIEGRTIPSARADQRFIVSRQPVGVVAAITPWNYPVSMITRKLGPALAAGCTMVLKPAEDTPLSAIAVFKILEQAGLPAGVINMITASEPEPIGAAFVSHPQVAKLTFTGSTAVGRMLAGQAATNMKRVSCELGGHAPFIVFKDADPIRAAKGASLVKFLNTGQACISPNRFYVPSSLHDAFTETLVERVKKMKAGSGIEEGVSIGPLVNAEAVSKIQNQVSDALERGAELAVGGQRLTENGLCDGHFYAPTVLTGVNNSMKIYSEETFGPIAPVISFDDEDQVLEMANDTHYGLAAYVYTQNLGRAMRMIEGLNFGIIGINDINPTAASVPFGGMKSSGVGREGGHEGIDEYLETKVAGLAI